MSAPAIAAVAAIPLAAPADAAALLPTLPAAAGAAQAAPAAGGVGRFGQIVEQGVQQVNDELVASQVDMQRLATGNASDLHRIMIGLEQSQLSFQLMMQVRNRLLDAYQDVMKMQV